MLALPGEPSGNCPRTGRNPRLLRHTHMRNELFLCAITAHMRSVASGSLRPELARALRIARPVPVAPSVQCANVILALKRVTIGACQIPRSPQPPIRRPALWAGPSTSPMSSMRTAGAVTPADLVPASSTCALKTFWFFSLSSPLAKPSGQRSYEAAGGWRRRRWAILAYKAFTFRGITYWIARILLFRQLPIYCARYPVPTAGYSAPTRDNSL
jgi:hypothetical protein